MHFGDARANVAERAPRRLLRIRAVGADRLEQVAARRDLHSHVVARVRRREEAAVLVDLMRRQEAQEVRVRLRRECPVDDDLLAHLGLLDRIREVHRLDHLERDGAPRRALAREVNAAPGAAPEVGPALRGGHRLARDAARVDAGREVVVEVVPAAAVEGAGRHGHGSPSPGATFSRVRAAGSKRTGRPSLAEYGNVSVLPQLA